MNAATLCDSQTLNQGGRSPHEVHSHQYLATRFEAYSNSDATAWRNRSSTTGVYGPAPHGAGGGATGRARSNSARNRRSVPSRRSA